MSAPVRIAVRCSIFGTSRRWAMCRACSDSYERTAHPILEALAWAAKRSRRATVAREKLRGRLRRAGMLKERG